MNSKHSIILLAMALSPASVVASPPSASPTEAPAQGLSIEVEPTVEQADRLEQRLAASGRKVLESKASPLAVDERILVHVVGELSDYQVRVVVTRGDVTLDDQTLDCGCTTTELAERIDAEIERATGLLAVEADEDGASKAPSGGGSEVSVVPSGIKPKPPLLSVAPSEATSKPPLLVMSPKTLARTNAQPTPGAATGSSSRKSMETATVRDKAWEKRVASVATLLVGSAFLVAGIGMLGAGSTELVDRVPHYERNWRPLGFALGGVGIAGVSVGGSLLLVSEVRCRRRPDTCPTSRRSTMAAVTHRTKNGAKQ